MPVQAIAGPPDQYKFSVLDINRGLSNNQVNAFLKDSRGYLWIGTADGLNRYDGSQLKVYHHEARDTTSIPSNIISSLFEDPAGKIWVETSVGMVVFDPVKERFYRNTAAFLEPYALAGNSVRDIYKDQSGDYWFLLIEGGLYRYGDHNQSVRLQENSPLKGGISSNNVLSMAQNSQGDYWLVHQNGIFERLDGKSLQVVERRNELASYFRKQPMNYQLMVDSDDELWLYIPFEPKGLFRYQPQQQKFSHIHRDSQALALNTNMVSSVLEEVKGTIWVGTDHGGINLISKENNTVSYILANKDVDNSLVQNSINALYKDAQGIIWIGTYKKGVNLYHENIIRFKHFKNQTSLPNSLPYDDVNRFAEDQQGNLWIGTNGGGLLYFNRATGTYTRYRHDPQNPNSLSSDVIVSMLVDRQGILWIGTYTGGLNSFDGTTFTHYRHDPRDVHSLPCVNDNVWELHEDRHGNLWVGTMRGGIARFDPAQKRFYRIPLGGGRKGLNSSYIAAIAEDKKGNIWVGGSAGVEVINPGTGVVTHYQNDQNNPFLLGNNHILDIHIDTDGNVWAGTQDGLNLFDEASQTFALFTKEQGLPHNTVLTILEDEEHNLWFGTPNGLSYAQVNRKLSASKDNFISFRNFSVSDGLQGNLFNENAAYKTSKGELIFGGPNGFNLFLPQQVKGSEEEMKLVFSDFQLFNQSISTGKEVHGRVLLPVSLADTRSITLKHHENVFSIAFTALSFLHPEKNTFRYKLEGFDRDWQVAGKGALKATYTNLDPGDYSFKVQALSSELGDKVEQIQMPITVLAPFWRTTTAYMLYVLLAFLTLYLVRKVELQRANMKFRLSQAKREAQQLHELDLMKIRFFTNVSHEFRTPLSLILAPLERLIQRNQESDSQKQYLMIQRNAKRLLNLVNQLLDFRKLEVEGVNLNLSEGNIIKFIEGSVHSFSDLSEKKNIQLSYSSEPRELQVSFDMDKLEKILFNLLSNAFKFTEEGGHIAISVRCLQNDSDSRGLKLLEIKVKDSGIGIPKDKQEKIFERFFRDEVPSNLVNQGSGIGLAITRDFVKIHGGTITVESAPGQGSTFVVVIPVKEICASTTNQLEEALPFSPAVVSEEANSFTEPEVNPATLKPEVLLIEDNEDFRLYLRDNLSQYFTIEEAKNGKEGWQKALSSMPDLIVSDLMMPELNGIDLCQKIKQDSRTCHIPFVLLTAHTAEEQKLRGLNIGANDYITKPFNFELLLSRLRNLIAQRQLMQQTYEKKISFQSSEQDIVSLDDKLIQKAIQVVEENLEDPEYTVEKLSRELGMSRVHLYKKLLSLTGKSPIEFMKKIRLQQAAQLLEKSQLSVAEVAYKVGFNNARYFTKCFKQEYKVIPSQYAAQHKQV